MEMVDDHIDQLRRKSWLVSQTRVALHDVRGMTSTERKTTKKRGAVLQTARNLVDAVLLVRGR